MKLTFQIALWCLLCLQFQHAQIQQQDIYRLAQAFEQQGNHERALQLYSDLYEKDPANYVYFDAVRRTNIQLKNYDAAISVSFRRLRLTPLDLALKANIGSLYSMQGKGERADSMWNAILLSAQKNQMVYRTVANEQANQRLFDRAVSTYLRGRSEIGDRYLFANELGFLYSFMMDFGNATREYITMLMHNQQQYDFVQSRLASIVVRTDGLASALSVVEAEVKRTNAIPLMRLYVWLLMEGKKYDEALTITRQLEQSVRSNGLELFNFAERLFREKEYRIASAAYSEALKNDSRLQFMPAARFGYARCIEELSAAGTATEGSEETTSTMLESRPSFSGAITLYSSLAREFPFSAVGANALYRIGMIRYKQLLDLDGALKIFDSVLTVSPGGPMVPEVLMTIGDIRIAQQQLEGAAASFRRMLTSSYAGTEQRNIAQFRLSEIQFFRNDFDSTLALLTPLTENLKADESNDALLLQYFITENRFQFTPALQLYSKAELLARQFKLSEAVALLRSILDLYPAAPMADDVLLKIGDYSIQMKQYPEALQAYRKLLEEYKESIERDKTQFRIGELFQFYILDKQKAIDAYEVILERYPYSLFREEARKRIRQLRGDAI